MQARGENERSAVGQAGECERGQSDHGVSTRAGAVRRRVRRACWVGGLTGVVVALVLEPTAAAAAAAGGIEEVKDFASKLTNYVTAIAASVAVLFMAISGVRWTMSSGNPMRQSEARNGLVSAAAGLAIALSANVIVSLVIAALQ
jgi:hypothetical protein